MAGLFLPPLPRPILHLNMDGVSPPPRYHFSWWVNFPNHPDTTFLDGWFFPTTILQTGMLTKNEKNNNFNSIFRPFPKLKMFFLSLILKALSAGVSKIVWKMNFNTKMMEKIESWYRCKICDEGERAGAYAQILIRIHYNTK